MQKTIVLIAFLFSFGCTNSKSEKEDIDFIKAFYRDYNKELSMEDLQNSNEDSVLKAYCTTRLISFLEEQYKEGLDWNPFLNGQDFNIETIKTLKIQKVKSIYNLYSASYIWAPTGELVDKIYLIIINEKGHPKIDYVYIGRGYEDSKYKDVEVKAAQN